MKINKTAYAAVIDGHVLCHHEGYVIGDDKRSVKEEAYGVWCGIMGWDRSKIEIVKIKLVEQE